MYCGIFLKYRPGCVYTLLPLTTGYRVLSLLWACFTIWPQRTPNFLVSLSLFLPMLTSSMPMPPNFLKFPNKLRMPFNPGPPGSSAGKESTCNAGDPSLIPGSGKSPGEGTSYPLQYSWASLVAQTVKNPPAMQKTWVGKIPWRKAWQPTLVFLPGESPWTEEPGGLQSMKSQRVGHG